MKFQPRHGAGGDDSSMGLSRALNGWLEEFGAVGIFRTCGSCIHSVKEGPAACSLFQATPPVAVILSGCENYEDEHEIPF